MSNLIISYILFANDLILSSEMPEGLNKLIDDLFNYNINKLFYYIQCEGV